MTKFERGKKNYFTYYNEKILLKYMFYNCIMKRDPGNRMTIQLL